MDLKKLLHDSDSADAELNRKIDKLVEPYVYYKIINNLITINLEDNHAYLMTIQSGADGELYIIYTTSGEARVCKISSNYSSSGVTKLSTISTSGLSLNMMPVTWVCCSVIALNK